MRTRARRSADTRRIYKLCSLLLCYPDEELIAARTDLRGGISELDSSPPAHRLEEFCHWWAAQEPLALQQHYIEVFDLQKRSGLYLTFYGDGDKRERGLALLRLKRMYRAAGLPLEGQEVPDYLPVMLEFAAGAPDGKGDLALREHRAALELLRSSLHERRTPYAGVVDAVALALGEPTAADRARARKLAAAGPPSELVGLTPAGPPTLGIQPHRYSGASESSMSGSPPAVTPVPETRR